MLLILKENYKKDDMDLRKDFSWQQADLKVNNRARAAQHTRRNSQIRLGQRTTHERRLETLKTDSKPKFVQFKVQ